MQYMLMCCIDEALWEGLPEASRDAVMHDYQALIQEMVTSGAYRGGARLQSVESATTLREHNGQVMTHDGPFAEAREQLGGFHVVECRGLDEALALARRIPPLRVGGAVEVRPVDPAYRL
nr:YciI family protein [Halomonas socia]